MNFKLLAVGGVVRLDDNACIPPSIDNADWRAYLAWVALGNTALPADAPIQPVDLADINNLDKVLRAVGLLMRDYCNALQAGAYTTKTIAQLRLDFMAKYNSLP